MALGGQSRSKLVLVWWEGGRGRRRAVDSSSCVLPTGASSPSATVAACHESGTAASYSCAGYTTPEGALQEESWEKSSRQEGKGYNSQRCAARGKICLVAGTASSAVRWLRPRQGAMA